MNFQKRILAMLLSVVACVGSVSYGVFASQKNVSNDTAPIYQDTCEHTYQNGVCTICGAEDPHWVVPADKDILPLTLDTPSTSSDSAYCVWYQFTAPETNFYRFQASGSTNIMGHSYYSLDDVNFNIGDPSDESYSSIFLSADQVEKGQTIYYYVRSTGNKKVSIDTAVVSVHPSHIIPDIIPDLPLNTKLSNESVYCAWYRFTAPEDGEYLFQSYGDADTNIWLLLHADLNNDDDFLAYSDDGGEDANFLLPYTLKKGETVYLYINDGYAYSDPISFSIDVRKSENIQIIPGDADLDGDVTIRDATLTLTYYAEQAVGNSYQFSEDDSVNQAIVDALNVDHVDGITLTDATSILTYYAEHAVGNSITWDDLIS